MSAITQTGPYMPKSDSGKRVWMENFIRTIADAPDVYGFSADDVDHYTRVIGSYLDAHRRAKDPDRRTTTTVREKNDARERAVELCRTRAMQIKADPTLTHAQKLAVGIHVDDDILTPVQRPHGIPKIVVLGSPTGGHTIRFLPRDAFGSKAKPKGVTHMLLYAAIGDEPGLGVQHARLLGAYTKQPFDVNYPPGCGVEGKHATYYGRWLTGKGDIGPWSPGASMIIARAVAQADVSFKHLFAMDAGDQARTGDVEEREAAAPRDLKKAA